MNTPRCEMSKECEAPVSYIDEKGFIYCTECGTRRQSYCRCRKLRPFELRRILNGQQIERYETHRAGSL